MKRIIILFVLVILLFFGIFVLTKTFSNEENVVRNIFKSEIYDSYKAGDIVNFADDEWLVMYDSSSKEDSMTLINSGILYLGEDGISDVIDGIYESSKLNEYGVQFDFGKYIDYEQLEEVLSKSIASGGLEKDIYKYDGATILKYWGCLLGISIVLLLVNTILIRFVRYRKGR